MFKNFEKSLRRSFKKSFKIIELLAICFNFLEILHVTKVLEYKQNLFLGFLIFDHFTQILGPFWSVFSPEFSKMTIFGRKMILKRVKMEKNQKSKKQVLFVFQNFSFMQTFKKIWTNGEEFYILEGFFWRVFLIWDFLYIFGVSRKHRLRWRP